MPFGITPIVYSNGIDVLFSISILLITMSLIIGFAKSIEFLLMFWQNHSRLKFNIYNSARLIGGLVFLIIALYYNLKTLQNLNLPISDAYIGIAFTVYGIAICLLLSYLSDRETKALLVRALIKRESPN